MTWGFSLSGAVLANTSANTAPPLTGMECWTDLRLLKGVHVQRAGCSPEDRLSVRFPALQQGVCDRAHALDARSGDRPGSGGHRGAGVGPFARAGLGRAAPPQDRPRR